jgi:hypothetical protein
MSRRFNISLQGTCPIRASEVWPDGDGPKNPTAKDVADKIKATCRDAGDLLTQWHMTGDFGVMVDGEEVW